MEPVIFMVYIPISEKLVLYQEIVPAFKLKEIKVTDYPLVVGVTATE
jgi:hypothetical protein